MLSGNALNLFKARMLQLLDQYAGVESREQQLVTDLQIAHIPDARAEDVKQALQALADDGLAARRLDRMRGWVWRVTRDGHAEAAALSLEDEG